MPKTESVTAQMKELLDEYSETVEEVVEDAAKTTAKECVNELKNTSPKGPKGYARSWTSKKHDGGWVVYNKEHYRLTHLLENGHAIVNQFGKQPGRVGPAGGKPHILPVEQSGIEEFQNKISRGLS